jgi:hypothetical protein
MKCTWRLVGWAHESAQRFEGGLTTEAGRAKPEVRIPFEPDDLTEAHDVADRR